MTRGVIVDSLVVSALVRLVAVVVCAQAYYLLGPQCKNYRTPPWYVRPAIAAFGAVATANVADLIYRVVSFPPRPLLTGYGLSLTEATLALALYAWLHGSWRPEAIQGQSQRKADNWRRMAAPCVRRRMILKERLKRKAEGAVDAGQLNRALKTENPAVTEDLASVMPDHFRDID